MLVPNEHLIQTIDTRVEQLYQETQHLSQELASLRLSESTMRDEVAALKVQVNKLQSIRLLDHKPFSGKPGSLEPYLVLCEMKFHAEPRTHSTDQHKILYAGLHLRGSALVWYGRIFSEPEIHNVQSLYSWEDFKERIRGVYGSPDPTETASAEICLLKQTRSVLEYTAKFQRLAAQLDWSDSVLTVFYKAGLCPEMRFHLACGDACGNMDSKTLASAIRSAQQIDQNIRGLQNATSMGPIPTDLGTTVHRGPLTMGKRRRPRGKTPCLYCGKVGHTNSECRSKPKVTPECS